jgi:hypothetical protein
VCWPSRCSFARGEGYTRTNHNAVQERHRRCARRFPRSVVPVPHDQLCSRTLRVKLRLAGTPPVPRIPPVPAGPPQAARPPRCQVTAATTGWTDRPPTRPAHVFPAARYGVYASVPPRQRAGGPHAWRGLPEGRACLQRPGSPAMALATATGHHRAGTRHTTPLAGLPRRAALMQHAPQPTRVAAHPHAG